MPQTIVVINGTSRTLQHVIEQALAKGDTVRAVVRSSSRFYSQTKKHDDLTAHEWSDFSDLKPLTEILDGVDVVYVAMNPPVKMIQRQATWINENAVESIGTVLRDFVPMGARSKAKLVLLAAHVTAPHVPPSAFSQMLLGNQFDDLRGAQDYLLKQAAWLDVVVITPGLILDCEKTSPEVTAAVRLQEGGGAPHLISYARLAAAMQMAASDDRWNGKFLLPVATTKVPMSIKHMQSPFDVFSALITLKVLPAALRMFAYAALAGGLGYVLGVRDQGAWPLKRFGLNLRA